MTCLFFLQGQKYTYKIKLSFNLCHNHISHHEKSLVSSLTKYKKITITNLFNFHGHLYHTFQPFATYTSVYKKSN